jgi:acetolactate synthase-1/2/3 large subunit
MSQELTGAQILCEALLREQVEILFGIPGGAIMPFYHALFGYRDRLRHVLCRHEQGAGHAAEGYARATGRVGVCVGTSGPGATNLVTPIADAYLDSTPLLVITGQVSSALLGTNAFQEIDITGVTLPITKHNYLVTDPKDIPSVIHEAMYLAQSGRPGPVLVDITKDCQQARTVPDWRVAVHLPGYDASHMKPVQDLGGALEDAAQLLREAQRPLIMAGNGVMQAGATDALLAFAEATQIPVVTTLHGLGAFPEDHTLALGMPGMHGWVHVNKALQACDVLLTLGARFDDRVTGKASTFAPKAQIIHVDVDASEIGKVIPVTVGIHGDARTVLEALLQQAGETSWLEARALWLHQIRTMQATYQHRQPYRHRPDATRLMPHDVYDALNRMFKTHGPYRVVTDVGQHQMWAAQLIDWHRPRSHITSGGAGTMGFALPAALGVALAYPDETVWVICGDGGFQMTNQEMMTVMQERVRNIKVVVINNGYLGMVRQWQELFEQRVYSNTLLSSPDFVHLAESYGWTAMRVDAVEGMETALANACATDGSVLMDFRIEDEVNVFPIVPQGKSIGEMMITETELLPV